MAEACRVDFYILTSPDRSPEQLACHLALRAWEQGHRVSVLTNSAGEAEQLDAFMWEFPPERFLPHGVGAAARSAPVRITPLSEGTADDVDVVINLTASPVAEPERFSRLLEIVPAETGRREQSRGKFRHYRSLGLSLETHEIGTP